MNWKPIAKSAAVVLAVLFVVARFAPDQVKAQLRI